METRVSFESFARAVTVAIPLLALLYVLSPYLWPSDHAPTSSFSDIHHQHAPNLVFLAQTLADTGELPRWNPQDFGGIPTIGDPQAGVYNPVYWILLLHPTVHAFGLMIVGYALIGVIGFVLYARRLGCSSAAAAAGATVFTLGGKVLLHLVLPGHTIIAPFFLVPLLLWSIDRATARPGATRIAATAVLAAVVAVSLHPQILLHTALVLTVAGIATARHAPDPPRALGALVVASLLACGLSAVHILPVGALAGEFSRTHPEFYDAQGWNVRNPEAYAHPLELIAGTAQSWEAHFYFGGITLWLVCLGTFGWPRGSARRPLVWLYGTLGLVLLLYGLGPEGGIHPLLADLPWFVRFRIPARALVALSLPVAILAMLGVDALLTAPRQRVRIVGITGAALAGGLLVLGDAPPRCFAMLGTAAVGVILVVYATGTRPAAGPSIAPHAPHPAQLAGIWLLLGALTIDTGAVITPWVATAPETTIGRPPAGVRLPDDIDEGIRVAEIARDTAMPGLPPLAVRRLGLETLAGFNPLVPWRFVLFASYASGYAHEVFNTWDVAVPLFYTRPALYDLLGVTHVLHAPADEGAPWRWQRRDHALPRAFLVPAPIVVPEGVDGADDRFVRRELDALATLEQTDPRRAVLLHGPEAARTLAQLGITPATPLEPFRPVPVVDRSPHRVKLAAHTERPAILVWNTPFFRGWRAWDHGDAVPVLRANVLLQAIALPPGEHDLVLEFSPTSWRIGWWISVAAACVTLAMVLAGFWHRRTARGAGTAPAARSGSHHRRGGGVR